MCYEEVIHEARSIFSVIENKGHEVNVWFGVVSFDCYLHAQLDVKYYNDQQEETIFSSELLYLLLLFGGVVAW